MSLYEHETPEVARKMFLKCMFGQELTVCPEKVIEQLEEGEAVPALRGLDLQSGIHVDGVKGQEVLCMLHHEVCPPCKRLETQHAEKQTGEPGFPVKRWDGTRKKDMEGRKEGRNNTHNWSSSGLERRCH